MKGDPILKKTYKIEVDCANCARKVENALNSLDGTWAKVAIDANNARVLCKTQPDEAAIRGAVRRAGYTITEYQER